MPPYAFTMCLYKRIRPENVGRPLPTPLSLNPSRIHSPILLILSSGPFRIPVQILIPILFILSSCES